MLTKSHIITAIYDIKAEKYSHPNLARSTGDFIRSVQVEAKNTQSMLNKFPSDYELHVIGEWSEDFAIIPETEATFPKRLGSVLDLCPLS